MADENGNIDTDKMAEFKPTMELRYQMTNNHLRYSNSFEEILQQKWTNELGDEEWRDIPLVISE